MSQSIEFIKMQAAGNDYVYIDAFRSPLPVSETQLPDLARRVSDRHYGIGSDGLVLIMPSTTADVRMRMFNADGSEAEMCGNAARCVGRYVYENGLCHQRQLQLETLAGPKTLLLATTLDDQVEQITVVMGTTIGNPHKVFITDQPVEQIAIHEVAGVNAEWVNVLNSNEIRMRVWERGTGETMACGTGACAAAVAAMDKGLTSNEVTVHLRGGDLIVSRDEKGIISLTGTATEVFRGILHL